ncbi:MAG TPA: aldolase/citrate lyase family protein [Casimicrobiaceae bacterium]|nr:aldolase/citrate lyase family protein [Casimicrobiaceae bacterium]
MTTHAHISAAPGMRSNPVRERLRAGGNAFGVMAFEFFTPGLSPLLAAAGADFVLLDMEHSGASLETVKAQIAYAHGAGIVPMVRVRACAYEQIAPVLDAGALGIMAPMIETREQAELLVGACRYRPEGRRGLGFGVAHDSYTAGAARPKMQAANDAILTIALIESARGVENAESILSVPGLDLGWLGHYDLSDSLGCVETFDDPRYRGAEQRLIAAATAAKKPLGWLVPGGEEARIAQARGFRCICIGHEVAVLRDALAHAFARARREG